MVARSVAGSDVANKGELCNLDRVLFLDVDGVLHPAFVQFIRQQFRPTNMGFLKQIIVSGSYELISF